MRSLDHSTIIYESPQLSIGPMSSHVSMAGTAGPTPLLRISPCSKDANLLATFHLDSSTVLILDVRQPGKELYNLTAHTGNINASTSKLYSISDCSSMGSIVKTCSREWRG